MYQDTVNKADKTGDSISIVTNVIHTVDSTPTEAILKIEKAEPLALPIVERRTRPIKKTIPVVEIEKKEITDTFLNPYSKSTEAKFVIFDTVKSPLTDSSFFSAEVNDGRFELFPITEKNIDFNSLFVFLFLGIGFLLVLLNRFYHHLTEIVLNSAINKQLSYRVLREKNIALRRSFFILNIFSVIVLSFFTWFVLKNLHDAVTIRNPQKAFFVILAIVSGTLLSRYILFIILSKLFIIESFMTHYLHNNYNLLKATSIVVMPILFVSKFSDGIIANIFFILAIIVFIIMLVYKYIRAIQLLFQFRFLNIYSILYFCTLEILPVLIGLKFFNKMI